jgi:hypothetical protein
MLSYGIITSIILRRSLLPINLELTRFIAITGAIITNPEASDAAIAEGINAESPHLAVDAEMVKAMRSKAVAMDAEIKRRLEQKLGKPSRRRFEPPHRIR